MIIKYCPKCSGKPYTKDYSMDTCRNCGTKLLSEIVNESDLTGRIEIPSFEDDYSFGYPSNDESGFGSEKSSFEDDTFEDEEPNQFGFGDPEPDGNFGKDHQNEFELPSERHSFDIDNNTARSMPAKKTNLLRFGNYRSNEVHASSKNIGSIIRGKITNYTNSQKENSGYKRFFAKRILDAIIYKQRFDDVLHSFTVRTISGTDTFGNQVYTDVPVNVHGVISGGVQLVNNIEVEVAGKYCNGILMANNISVINNGYKSSVYFRHSIKAVLYGILAIFAAIFLIYIGASSEGGFFENIGSFLKIWLISAVIITVLYFIAIFSKIGIMARMATGKPRKFPWIGILLISLVIALIIFNSAGIGASVGSALTGILSSAISVIVLLVVLFIVFKLILGLF